MQAFEEAQAAAKQMGLETATRETTRGVTITVSRSAPDWSMAPTPIGIGQSLEDASRSALVALRKMEPQIRKKLAEAQVDQPDSLTIAAGVGSDGTVNTLRVERDGTVRLSPEDIENIADALAHRMVRT